MNPLKIVIIGSPGSGKQTQGKELAKKYDLEYTGYRECLVHHLTRKTELGDQYRPFFTQKKAVPGELMNQMVHEVIDSEKGFIIQGYPITVSQAECFIEEFHPDLCIFIRIPEELSRERLKNRRIDPETRAVYNLKMDPPPEQVAPRVRRMKSDSPENINKRLFQYYSAEDEFEVLKKFDYVVEVDGNQSKEELHLRLCDEIEKYNFQSGRVDDEKVEEEEESDDVEEESDDVEEFVPEGRKGEKSKKLYLFAVLGVIILATIWMYIF